MKRTIIAAALVSVFMLLIPLSALSSENGQKSAVEVIKKVVATDETSLQNQDGFRVADKQSGEVQVMDEEDYIFGVVAAEMPASYEAEALKAQAVAAYTYASYKRNANKLKEYDITTDYKVDQSYKSDDELRNQWGEKYEEYKEKIMDAVRSVKGIMLTNDGKPILAVYHAVSPGRTASAKDVWGDDIPYLQSVLSTGDKLAKNYLSKVTVTADDIKSKFKDGETGIKDIELDGFGYVKSAKIGNKKYSAGEIRSAFELRSAFFKITENKKEIKFEVFGHGHGVGMSQNGANYMAKQGYTFKEILNHYYTGCKISEKE